MAARPDEICDVLIVGGSLVGLSAAAFLGWHGVPARVIEKHAGTSIHPRAGYFHIGTMEAYRRIGLEPAIRQASEEQFGPDGGINAVESLAGRELARHVDSINAGTCAEACRPGWSAVGRMVRIAGDRWVEALADYATRPGKLAGVTLASSLPERADPGLVVGWLLAPKA